jgi:hypothetical protein
LDGWLAALEIYRRAILSDPVVFLPTMAGARFRWSLLFLRR